MNFPSVTSRRCSVALSPIRSMPYCTPCRGSSMCTTVGTPSNRQSSTAGASRSSRNSRTRPVVEIRVVGLIVGDVTAHVQRRPAGHRAGAQQEPGDRARRGEAHLLAADHPNPALLAVDLVADRRVQLLELVVIERGDGADRQRTLHQRVRPLPVEEEEPDRLGRQQLGVRHEVLERDALQQPGPGQERPHLRRQQLARRDGGGLRPPAGPRRRRWRPA